jgi:outer membrane protein
MNKFFPVFIIISLLASASFCQTDSLSADTLTIKECVKLALENNPQIKLAESNLNISSSNLVGARSSLFPQISMQSGFTRSGGTTFLGPTARQGNYSNYSLGFQAQQLIFDFGKTYSSISAASSLEDASAQDLISAKQDLILNTYIAYFTYLQASRAVKASTDVLSQAEDHLKQAEGFYKVGTKPKLDVLEAQTDEENARVNLLNAKSNLKISRLQLENILSTKLSNNFSLQDNLEVRKDSITEASALNAALDNRPELIASKYRVEASKSLVTSAWASNLPSISASGGYTWRSYSLDTRFPDTWNVGVALSLPIFAGFGIDAKVQYAKASLDNSIAQNNLTVQAVTLDVRQQYSNLEIAESKISATKSLLNQAEETLKVAEGRYAQSVGSQLEVTDARVAYYNAQISYIQALYDYQVAYVRLLRATGTLK